jgi:hypothetical protein
MRTGSSAETLMSVCRAMVGVLRFVSIFLEATPVLVVLVKRSVKTREIVQLLTSALLIMEDVNTCVRKVESVQDVNECLADNGGCSEICVNLPGSYTCACGTGKEISEDRRSCTVVDKCLIEY